MPISGLSREKLILAAFRGSREAKTSVYENFLQKFNLRPTDGFLADSKALASETDVRYGLRDAGKRFITRKIDSGGV